MSLPEVTIPLLVIDDDALSREVLELLLGSAGFLVKTVGSGEHALAELSSGAPSPAVLSDLQMPGLAGPELARCLRALPAPPPVMVAMSGSEPPPGATQGFDAFLLKPFSAGQLRTALGRLDGSQTAAGEDGLGPVHEATLVQLRSSMRAAQLRELFQFAIDDAGCQLQLIEAAMAEADDASFRRAAHALKGSFGLLGAPELRSLATRAEDRGLAAATNHTASPAQFRQALDRLRRTLVALDVLPAPADHLPYEGMRS